MGKAGQIRRSRLRMTSFNIEKAKQLENILKETILSKCSKEMDKALEKQKEYYAERHHLILKQHSERLKHKYEENFNNAIDFYIAEIESLKLKLFTQKQKYLVSHKVKPVYSPGRYEASSDPDNG